MIPPINLALQQHPADADISCPSRTTRYPRDGAPSPRAGTSNPTQARPRSESQHGWSCHWARRCWPRTSGDTSPCGRTRPAKPFGGSYGVGCHGGQRKPRPPAQTGVPHGLACPEGGTIAGCDTDGVDPAPPAWTTRLPAGAPRSCPTETWRPTRAHRLRIGERRTTR